MRPLQLILAIVVVIAPNSSLLAQTPSDPALEQGIQPFQSYEGGDLDSVNLATGLLSLHIPVISFPQRGTLHLDYSVNYVNPTLTIATPYKTYRNYQISPYGLSLVSDAFPIVRYTVNVLPCTGCAEYALTLIEGNGTGHPVGFINSAATQARSLDVTGFLVNSPLVSNCSITDRSGVTTAWANGVATAIDPNGNQMTQTNGLASGCYNASDGPLDYMSGGTVTDSMGRTIPSTLGVSWSAPGAVGNYTNSWTVPGPNGGTATYQLTGSASGESLVLPDLTAYTFTFEKISLPILNPQQTVPQTVEVLSSVSLPSGGSISYSYGSNISNEPIITSRTVNANDGTGPHTYSYSYSYSSSTGLTTETTTVTDPLGNISIHTFSPYGPYETQLQEEDNSGNILKNTQTSYNDALYDIDAGSEYVNFSPSSITTIWPNGQQNTVSLKYDINNGSGFYAGIYRTGPGEPGFVASSSSSSYTANPWSKIETAYGNGASGAVLRTTNTSYFAFSNASYLANNLLDLPFSVQVQDGGGAQRAYATYGYDESGLQPSGVTTQKVAGESYPGNQTSVHRWLSNGNAASQSSCNVSVASGGYLTTNNVYFDSGELQKSTDPCLHTTSYIYSSAYYGAYPTTVTNVLGQQITTGYDFNTGLPTSVADPNSRTTSKSYDVMGRLTGVSSPDGGSTSYCYTDMGGASCSLSSAPPFSVVSTRLMSSSPALNEKSTNVFDGLGRVSLTQINSDSAGATNVVTTYDALGRTHTVSNPYRNTSDSTYGITTYTYDALGRRIEAVGPDGSILQTCYNGIATTPAVANCSSHLGQVTTGTWVDSTDGVGNHWQRTSDALGRLTEVMEPNGITQSPSIETDYGYDALNNLLSVNQRGTSGATARVRGFTYDSLSRLITSSNPETGTICYGQLNGANCINGYDANGNLVQKTDARGVTTTYSYDALNRLLSKAYPAGTASSCYQYDQSSLVASGGNLIGRLTNSWTQTGSCPAPTAPPAFQSASILSRKSILAYDAMGRMTSQQQCTKSNCNTSTSYSPAYTYDLAGNLITHSSGIGSGPFALTFTNGYDGAGHLCSVLNGAANLFTIPQYVAGSGCTSANPTLPGYSAAGGLMNATFGTGLQLSRFYDNRLRISSETDTGNATPSQTPGAATITISGTDQTH